VPPQPAGNGHAAPLSLPSDGMPSPGSDRDPRLKPPALSSPALKAQHEAQHEDTAEADIQHAAPCEDDTPGNQQEGNRPEEDEEARRCSHCSCTWTSGGWYKHSATWARLCNACWQFSTKNAGQLPDKGVLERRERVRHGAQRQCAECGSADPSSGRSYDRPFWHRHPANQAQSLCMPCGRRVKSKFKRQMQLNGAERPAAQQDTSIGQQPYNKAALAAPNSAQVHQPQDVPQPSSAAALLSDPAATAKEVRAEKVARMGAGSVLGRARSHMAARSSARRPQHRSENSLNSEATSTPRPSQP
jgi:hypothetical protein